MAAAAIAPVVLAAGGKAAKGAANTISEALTADLAVVKWRSTPRKRSKHSPIDYEIHINPAALGVAAVGAGLTLWLMQLRVGVQKASYGYWAWPDDTKASKELPEPVKGDAPSRIDPAAPPKPFHTDPIILAFQLAQWVAQNTQIAHWVSLGEKEFFGIGQRAGFGSFGSTGQPMLDEYLKSYVIPTAKIAMPWTWFL